MTIVSLQPYKPKIHFFYSTLPIGDDSSFDDRMRKFAVELQQDFENVQGCVAVIFVPAWQHPTGLTFLQGYFQRHNLRKVVEANLANGMELWSSNQEGR